MRYSLVRIVCDADLDMMREQFTLEQCEKAYQEQLGKFNEKLLMQMEERKKEFNAFEFSHDLLKDLGHYHAISNLTQLEEVMDILKYMGYSYELNYIHHPNKNFYLIRVLSENKEEPK